VGDSSAHANTDGATGLVGATGATNFVMMFNIVLCLRYLKYDVYNGIIFASCRRLARRVAEKLMILGARRQISDAAARVVTTMAANFGGHH